LGKLKIEREFETEKWGFPRKTRINITKEVRQPASPSRKVRAKKTRDYTQKKSRGKGGPNKGGEGEGNART